MLAQSADLRRTRILLVALSGVLREIIASLVAGVADMELVGYVARAADVSAAVDRTGADVVVLGLGDSQLPEDSVRIFDQYPRIKVMGIAADGRRAFLYELRPHRTALGEVSPQRLLEAIRTAVQSQVC